MIRWGLWWPSGTHGGAQGVGDRRIIVREAHCESNLQNRPQIAVAMAVRSWPCGRWPLFVGGVILDPLGDLVTFWDPQRFQRGGGSTYLGTGSLL